MINPFDGIVHPILFIFLKTQQGKRCGKNAPFALPPLKDALKQASFKCKKIDDFWHTAGTVFPKCLA